MKLTIRNLEKNYGNKAALKGISAELTEGIYGFLGPNGAGKSTFMNILTGNLDKTSGEILYNGQNILTMGKEFRGLLGYMPQQQALYPSFSAIDFLSYVAALREMDKKTARKRIPEVLEAVELSDVANKKIGSFSGGMKQRLLIAQAVLADPKILILDEPTAGLDPKQRISIRNLISGLSEDKIVLIATHVVTDVESIANRILLLREGELLTDAPREELIASLAGKVWELTLSKEEFSVLPAEYLVGRISREGETLYVRVIAEKEPETFAHKAERPGLEDVYLYYFRE